ncbi:MAG: peptide MFS transporter [Tannerella sp.]|jgi:POT family proton-dependent oligopeptide transporter|nr:peptide MFS transporter [Tannerella sp.]
MTQNSSTSHPKGLYFIFVTAMSERLSYYGMRAIFTLYLVKALMMDKELASMIYGNYTGLVYLTPLIGGYIADRYWGMRRSIFWGAVMMLFGQLFMFFSALYYENAELTRWLMYGGLGMLIFGNGFFKPCVSSLVGQLYEPNDKRLDSAYTIFYMGVNVGALIAPLICGWLGDTGNPADFKWGFLAATIGMSGSLILYVFLKDRYLIDPKGVPLGVEAAGKAVKKETTEKSELPKRSVAEFVLWSVAAVGLFAVFHYLARFDLIGAFIFASCLVVPAFVLTDRSLAKIERERIWVIFIMAFFVIFFWSAFEQAGASLTYFADEQTNRNILGWTMPASFFQSFNAVFVVLFAPLVALLWPALAKRNIDPASPTKQAIGMFLLSVGYLVIAFGVKGAAPGMKVSMLWLVGLYFIHTLGELSLSPIGLSMVNKLSPVRFASLLMGIWYLANATANKFAGMLSGLYPEAGVTKHFLGYGINTLFDFFMLFVIMSGVASVVLFILSKTLQKMMNGVR